MITFLKYMCFANRVEWLLACCSDSLTSTYRTCVLLSCMCRCHVMTCAATLHQQKPGGIGGTSPASGRPVANLMLCLRCLYVRVFFRYPLACCSASVSTCLAGPGVIFLRAGAPQASFVLLHPCQYILLAMYSEVTACMHQLLCTAVSSAQLSSSHSIILHICFTLHVYFFFFTLHV
jgi:hypothetical protein